VTYIEEVRPASRELPPDNRRRISRVVFIDYQFNLYAWPREPVVTSVTEIAWWLIAEHCTRACHIAWSTATHYTCLSHCLEHSNTLHVLVTLPGAQQHTTRACHIAWSTATHYTCLSHCLEHSNTLHVLVTLPGAQQHTTRACHIAWSTATHYSSNICDHILTLIFHMIVYERMHFWWQFYCTLSLKFMPLHCRL